MQRAYELVSDMMCLKEGRKGGVRMERPEVRSGRVVLSR